MSSVDKSNISQGPPNLSRLDSEHDNSIENEHDEASAADLTDCIVFVINEANLCQSPQMKIQVADKFDVNAILDSGSEVNLLAESVYEKLIKSGIELPILPVQSVVLVTAFGKKSKRIRYQTLIDFMIGEDPFESVF
jgi:hypothetical protein